MRLTKLVRSAIGTAAVLAVLAPSTAQAAPNFQFACPGCETKGGGPTVFNDNLYVWTTMGGTEYELFAAGTNTGDILFSFYTGVDGSGMGTGLIASYLFEEGSNPNTFVGFFTATGSPTYVGATGDCVGPGVGCNVVLKTRVAGSDDPLDVPEPATMILLGTGLVGVLGARRRRRTQLEA